MTQALPNLQARLSACRGVLVDSNVLLDVATNDPGWGDWSAQRTRRSRRAHDADHQSDHLCRSVDRLYDNRSSGRGSSCNSVSARTASLGGRFPGREELPAIPTPRGLADLASAGFLHRRACRHRTSGTAHARCGALSQLFSDKSRSSLPQQADGDYEAINLAARGASCQVR